jgi:hypothetical protein
MKCCSRGRETRTVMVETGNRLVDVKVAWKVCPKRKMSHV